MSKDWIKHIQHTHADKIGTAWCGRRIAGFAFQDIDHAAYNGMANGRLVACKQCTKAIIRCLTEGQDE